MQIACKRYGCQKAVEVCYWSCKYRRNCKDWKSALEQQPGVEPIRERLELAAAKSGRLFDLATLVKPARNNHSVSAQLPVLPSASPAPDRVPAARPRRSRRSATTKTSQRKEAANKMAKRNTEAVMDASQPETRTSESAKAQTPKPKKRAPRAKPATNGVVYLLLEKNGKYKELREADLIGEASRMLKDPSLRLIKGQLLIPRITLRPAGE